MCYRIEYVCRQRKLNPHTSYPGYSTLTRNQLSIIHFSSRIISVHCQFDPMSSLYPNSNCHHPFYCKKTTTSTESTEENRLARGIIKWLLEQQKFYCIPQLHIPVQLTFIHSTKLHFYICLYLNIKVSPPFNYLWYDELY